MGISPRYLRPRDKGDKEGKLYHSENFWWRVEKFSDRQLVYYSHTLRWLRYNKFLRTDYWACVRKERLKIADGRCEVCGGDKEELQARHISWDHRGQIERRGNKVELLEVEDIRIKCRICIGIEQREDKIVKMPQR